MNCDVVLDAVIQQGENELKEKQRKADAKDAQWNKLKTKVSNIHAKSTDCTTWNQGELIRWIY